MIVIPFVTKPVDPNLAILEIMILKVVKTTDRAQKEVKGGIENILGRKSMKEEIREEVKILFAKEIIQ